MTEKEEFLSESNFEEEKVGENKNNNDEDYSAKSFASGEGGTKKKINLRPCIFCEFVHDIRSEEEYFESKDEQIILYHLRHDHGMDR
jgi:hypothetical protein